MLKEGGEEEEEDAIKYENNCNKFKEDLLTCFCYLLFE